MGCTDFLLALAMAWKIGGSVELFCVGHGS